MAALATPADSRERLYQGLNRRNRIVGILRWLVPAAGVVLLAVMVGLIALDAITQRFGFANIRIDRDNLVVETPEFTSTDADGTLYALTARAAKVSATNTELVDIEDATLTMTPRNGPKVTAQWAAARLQTSDLLLDVPGTANLTSTDGLAGTLDGVFADLMNWKMTASGKVDIKWPDGSTIVSDGMSYDRKSGTYTFKDVTVTLTETPGETP